MLLTGGSESLKVHDPGLWGCRHKARGSLAYSTWGEAQPRKPGEESGSAPPGSARGSDVPRLRHRRVEMFIALSFAFSDLENTKVHKQ